MQKRLSYVARSSSKIALTLALIILPFLIGTIIFNSLKSDHDDAIRKNKSVAYEATIQKLEKELSLLRADYSETMQQNENLQKQLDHYDETIAALKDNLSQLKTENIGKTRRVEPKIRLQHGETVDER